MAGSGRSPKSQSKHDREVEKIVEEYKEKGYSVSADIRGYSKPKTVSGYRPDVVATKDNREIIIEVETLDSLNSVRDLEQKGAFQRAARKPNVKFIRRITK